MSEGDDTGVSPQSGEQKTEDKKHETNSVSVPAKKVVDVAEEVTTENGHGDVKDNEIKENNLSEDVESPKEKGDKVPQENKEVTKDTENKESDPPKTEEMDVSESHDDKVESETINISVEGETPMEESEPVKKGDAEVEKSEIDGDTESTPKEKKSRKKAKRGPSYYYEEVNEGDEEALGSVERTPVVESGKRERKKVERLSMASTFTPPEKKAVEIPEGSGDRLGDSQAIEFQLNRHHSSDLKALHKILFGSVGVTTLTKRNIRQFSGFAFDKTDKDYQKKMDSMNKDICKVLDIERSGTKDSIIQRILDFLMCPKISEKKRIQSDKKGIQSTTKLPKTRKKRATKKEMEERRKSAEQTKIKTKKDVGSDEEGEEQSGEESGEEGQEEEEEVSEEEQEPEPPKKKKKVETSSPKKASKKEEKPSKKSKKQNQKEEIKKESKKETKKESKKEKSKEKKEKKKQASEDNSSEEDEPLDKKRKEAPGNDELKDLIKKILDGADLEKVTMKTVVKQVYGKYPDFDLTDRKEFIKNTVKQIIS